MDRLTEAGRAASPVVAGTVTGTAEVTGVALAVGLPDVQPACKEARTRIAKINKCQDFFHRTAPLYWNGSIILYIIYIIQYIISLSIVR
jgi:hypothetical protein